MPGIANFYLWAAHPDSPTQRIIKTLRLDRRLIPIRSQVEMDQSKLKQLIFGDDAIGIPIQGAVKYLFVVYTQDK